MLLLSARWPRPPGRWEISKWTKIWRIFPGHEFVRGVNFLGRRYSDGWDWRIGKVGCIRHTSQKTECEKSPDNQKNGEFVFPAAVVQQKYQGSTERREISAENLMAIGKSFNLKKQKMTKESIRISGLTQKLGKNVMYRHHIEPRSSTNVPREESFLISQDLHFWTGSEDSGDQSLKDSCLGKPRSVKKRSFIPNNVDSRCKGDYGKGMKGSHKEGT